MERILNSKSRYYMLSGMLFCLMLFLPMMANSNRNDPVDSRSAKVVFPEPIHNFSPLVEGKLVFHDFIIRNKGGEILEVSKINTG